MLSREQTVILYGDLAPNSVHIKREHAPDPRKKRFLLHDQDHTLVVVHPSSINQNNLALASAFLTYAVNLHTSQIYLYVVHRAARRRVLV